MGTGCQVSSGPDAEGAQALAFEDDLSESIGGPDQQAVSTTVTTAPPPPSSTTIVRPVPLGSPRKPFVDLGAETVVRAVRTPTDIVLPVLGDRHETWMVMTACEDTRYVAKNLVDVVERAHIVLDPGHGGTEPGTVGPKGTVEKDLNLRVSLEAARVLSEAGASVVLTRTADHNLTTGFRGLLTKSIDPALFVSVHHNGGAPRSGSDPGTIVLTKSGNNESRRFGGLFYDSLNKLVRDAAEAERQANTEYLARLAEYEAVVDAYDRSVQARDAALLANGQITDTTVPAAAPEPVDGLVFPRKRDPIPTTTRPPATVAAAPTTQGTNGEDSVDGTSETETATSSTRTAPPKTVSTIPVPDTLPVPEPFTEPPIREFMFSGGGNRGVRSWTRADGKDYLSVLRHSDDVPAVLAEFLYVTNPSEEELLMDPEFVAAEGAALAEAVIEYFSSPRAQGSGFVDDQFDDQPIGGGGRPSGCVEPDYGLGGVAGQTRDAD